MSKSNPSSAPGLSLAQSAVLTRRATTLSVAVAAVLIVIKAVAWYQSGSVSMMASLADSSLDLVASLATFFAVRYAVAPPDAEHRFGHGKAEAFASLLQGGLVFASAALIGQEALNRLAHPEPVSHEGLGMAVMAVSIVLTVGLIAAQSAVLKQTGSVAVSGDRAHYAADLASNLVSMVGIGAAIFLPQADAVAGLVVAAWLVWGALGVFSEASVQLMDRELPDEQRARIIALMTVDPRIMGVHQLRSRASGPYIHIQMHADIDPTLTLVEAHNVMVAAENRVLVEFPSADILIHPDPRGQAEPHGGAFAETLAAHDGHTHH
jgi:cation diffusion facilitator family transporter